MSSDSDTNTSWLRHLQLEAESRAVSQLFYCLQGEGQKSWYVFFDFSTAVELRFVRTCGGRNPKSGFANRTFANSAYFNQRLRNWVSPSCYTHNDAKDLTPRICRGSPNQEVEAFSSGFSHGVSRERCCVFNRESGFASHEPQVWHFNGVAS